MPRLDENRGSLLIFLNFLQSASQAPVSIRGKNPLDNDAGGDEYVSVRSKRHASAVNVGGFGGWVVDGLAGGVWRLLLGQGSSILPHRFNCVVGRSGNLPGTMQIREEVSSDLQPRPSSSEISFHAGGEPDSTVQGRTAHEDSLKRTLAANGEQELKLSTRAGPPLKPEMAGVERVRSNDSAERKNRSPF